MSNLESASAEVTCATTPAGEAQPGRQILGTRPVPLGGPRAMTVRRTCRSGRDR